MLSVFPAYGSLRKLDSNKMIFAGGAGIRYLVSAAQRVALRLDVAKGRDQTMVYISVGEAF